MKLKLAIFFSYIFLHLLGFTQNNYFVGAKVKENNYKCDIFNEKGEKLNPEPCEWVYQIRPGYFCVTIHGVKSIYNKEWKKLPVPEFKYVKSHNKKTDEIFAVLIDGKWGYYNFDGKLIIDHIYLKASNFEYGEAIIQFKDRIYFINNEGDYQRGDASTNDKQRMQDFESALFSYGDNMDFEVFGVGSIAPKGTELFKKYGKIGLREIDNGNTILNPVYDEILDFIAKDKFGVVKKTGKYGVVSMDRIETVPSVYNKVWKL